MNGLGVYILTVTAVLTLIIIGAVFMALGTDTSSWIVDGDCITLYRSDNNVFEPDQSWVDTYCKEK
jgi:hypothetical protein